MGFNSINKDLAFDRMSKTDQERSESELNIANQFGEYERSFYISDDGEIIKQEISNFERVVSTSTFRAVKSVGRPSIGKTKRVSLTLPENIWEEIEKHGNNAAYLRDLVLDQVNVKTRGERKEIQDVFTFLGEKKTEWSNNEYELNKELLAQLTNEEFAEEVQKEFDDMNGNANFEAEVCEIDYSKEKYGGQTNIYVCLGHFIYTHIWIFTKQNGYVRKDILNHDYYKSVVKPFMSKIKQ